MSSSPTNTFSSATLRIARWFQSAVAHELFSDAPSGAKRRSGRKTSFKALSRMSSSPTARAQVGRILGGEFQSAVAHELFSDARSSRGEPQQSRAFQSAVAHELFSDVRSPGAAPGGRQGFKALSRMSSSPTGVTLECGMHTFVVSKRCRA